MADVNIDATNMMCPLPLLKVKAALLDMRPGQILRLVTREAGSKSDILEFVSASAQAGLLEVKQENQVYACWIQKQAL